MQTGANAGRLLHSYLSGKPLLRVSEMEQHSWVTPRLQYALITARCTSLSKESEILSRPARSQVNITACCHQGKVWLTLLPLPPDHVLSSNSLGTAGACRGFLWSDLTTNTQKCIHPFCPVRHMQPSSHEAGGWSLHTGAEAQGGEGNWTSIIR